MLLFKQLSTCKISNSKIKMETRNKKYRRKKPLACANCSVTENQLTDICMNISENCQNITLVEALNSIFNLNLSNSASSFRRKDDNVATTTITMCSKCAEVVSHLYKFYTELMELSQGDGILANVLDQTRLWHEKHGNGKSYLEKAFVADEHESIHDDNVRNEQTEIVTQDYADNLQVKVEISEETDDNDPFFKGIGEPSPPSVTDNSTESNNSNHRRKLYMKSSNFVGDKYLKSKRRRIIHSDTDDNSTAEFALSSSSEDSNIEGAGRIDERLKSTTENKNSRDNVLTRVTPCRNKKRTFELSKRTETSQETTIESDICKSIATIKDPDELHEPIPKKKRNRKPVPPPPLDCDKCNSKFSWHWMIEHHKLLVHSEERPKECDKCGFTTFIPDMLKTHICIPKSDRDLEKRERPFRCAYCGKSLISKGKYYLHCNNHDIDFKFPCLVRGCRVRFRTAENLEKHKKFHTRLELNPPGWQCSVCGKILSRRLHLFEHMNTHAEEKKYLCTRCGMRFAQNTGLFRHLQYCQEENNLRYQCPLCEKQFKRGDHVKQHLNQKVHPKELVAIMRSRGVEMIDTRTKKKSKEKSKIIELVADLRAKCERFRQENEETLPTVSSQSNTSIPGECGLNYSIPGFLKD